MRSFPPDGRSVVQLEIRLLDDQGQRVHNHDLPVTLAVTGGTLLGMDNGRPDDHALYASGTRDTFGGLAYAVIRAAKEGGALEVAVSAPGLDASRLRIPYCPEK